MQDASANKKFQIFANLFPLNSTYFKERFFFVSVFCKRKLYRELSLIIKQNDRQLSYIIESRKGKTRGDNFFEFFSVIGRKIIVCIENQIFYA